MKYDAIIITLVSSALMSAEELSNGLYNAKFKAVLLDSYVAAQSPDYFPKTKARVNKIIKSSKAFGFVPGQTMTNDDALIKCFRNYVEQNKQSISEAVEKATKTLEVWNKQLSVFTRQWAREF